MRYFRTIVGWVTRVAIAFVSLLVLYVLLAVILTVIPTNKSKQPQDGITVFIRTNGVHTDFILPLDRSEIDWFQYIKIQDFKDVYAPQYITFGWGDKGFYIETPEWSDLKASTACKALFFLSTTAMHVSYLSSEPTPDGDCKKLVLSEIQFKKLIDYIISSFQSNRTGGFILIQGKGYGTNDNFYEATGTYSFIKTCNCWLNNGLKQSGVRTATWAPFDKCIFYYR